MTVPAEAEAHHHATAGALCRARLLGRVGRSGSGRSGSERVGAEHIIVEQTSSKFRKVHKIQPTTNAFFSGSVRSGSVGDLVGDLGQVGVGSERIRRVTSTVYVHSTTAHDHPAAAVASAPLRGQKRRRATQPSEALPDGRLVGFPFFPKAV